MCITLPFDAADRNWHPTERRRTGMMQFITTLNHTHTLLLHSESQTYFNILRSFTTLNTTFSLTILFCLAPTNRHLQSVTLFTHV